MQSTHVTHPMSSQGPFRFNYLLRALPPILLLGAITAAVMMGSHNKPGDELDWLSRLASEGDSGAQLELGLAYRDGRYGLTPDARTGFYWLSKSAHAGNAYAEDALGNAYAAGEGTERDLEAAQMWWHKAINDGDKEARLHLGEALLSEGHVKEAESYLEQ